MTKCCQMSNAITDVDRWVMIVVVVLPLLYPMHYMKDFKTAKTVLQMKKKINVTLFC